MKWSERTNPCAIEWYARAMAWAETDCWCCSATRGLIVGVLIGAVIALSALARIGLAAAVLVIGAPIVVVALVLARYLWTEEPAGEDTQGGEPKSPGRDGDK